MGSYGQCRSCGKRIMFIKMKSGKNMPVDSVFVNFKRQTGGKDRIVLPSGEVVAGEIVTGREGMDGYGYISHFATCPMASRHRK